MNARWWALGRSAQKGDRLVQMAVQELDNHRLDRRVFEEADSAIVGVVVPGRGVPEPCPLCSPKVLPVRAIKIFADIKGAYRSLFQALPRDDYRPTRLRHQSDPRYNRTQVREPLASEWRPYNLRFVPAIRLCPLAGN
jgi:hypothetical protein